MTVIVLLGFTVGIILALTGAGGGILAVPLLVFGAGLSMAEAGPSGLLAVGLAAALGALMGLKSGTVRYKAATLIAAAGVICSPLGLWLAQRSPSRPLTTLALSGVVTGTLSGLLGVGGCFVMVAALQRFTNLGTQSIVATSLAVIALVSIAGVAAGAASGHLQWAIALPIAGGALGGMMGGRTIAARLSGPHLQKAFALVSAAVAVALFVKAMSA